MPVDGGGGFAVQPTGENGATRAPIVVDLQREPGLSSKSIVLQIDSKSQQVSASELDLVTVLPASVNEFLMSLGLHLIINLTLPVSCCCADSLRFSLQDRLSKAAGGSGRGAEIYLKLRTSTGLSPITSSIISLTNL